MSPAAKNLGALAREAEAGAPAAMYEYALALAGARGPADADCARWMSMAATAGEPRALRDLGMAYRRGLFGTTDLRRAVECFSAAAKKGDQPAQFHLGTMLLNGEGVEQNLTHGLVCLIEAARGGHAPARELALSLGIEEAQLGQPLTGAPVLPEAAVDVPGVWKPKFRPEEWEALLELPFSMFYMVGIADGKVDAKELSEHGRQLERMDYRDPLARELFAAVRADAERLRVRASDLTRSAARHEAAKAALQRVLTKGEYASFTRTLYGNARLVAMASGGFFGFGNTISEQEAEVLRALAKRFEVAIGEDLAPGV